MTAIRIVRDYPHPPAKVWRVLTDPALIARWAMRPEGFEAKVGNKSRFVAKPNPRWRGYVEVEVLAVEPQRLLRYSWCGDDSGATTTVTYALEATPAGTRLSFAHEGFAGIGGSFLARLMMGPGWKKMLHASIPAVLAEVGDDGALRAGSLLKPKY